MTPIVGFAPDAPRTSDGIIADCFNFIPYESGMESAPSAASTGIAALAAACLQATTITKLDGTSRTFAASATRIYELSGTSWTDRSAGGGAYTTTTAWQFTQFGDATLAASPNNTLQASTTGAFAAVSGAPQARVLFSVITGGGGFVIAANTGTAVDQVHNSAVNDHTSWTVSVATQANTARLLGNDAGAITAGIEFGDRPVIFKRRTMFLGNYVGAPDTFNWNEVPGGAGCVGPNAVVTIDQGLFFLGPDQFWIFDGARPIPIADSQLRQWFFDNSNPAYLADTRMVYDRPRNRVFIFYASASSSGSLDQGLCYHLVRKQWGRLTPAAAVQATLTFIQPAITYNGLPGTFNALTYTFDSSELVPTSRTIAVFNGTNTMQTLNGTPGASWFISSDFGMEDRKSHFTELRLRYDRVTPTTASIVGYTLDEAGDSADPASTSPASDIPSDAKNRFKPRQCAKFHRFRADFTGTTRVIGYEPTLLPAGGR